MTCGRKLERESEVTRERTKERGGRSELGTLERNGKCRSVRVLEGERNREREVLALRSL